MALVAELREQAKRYRLSLRAAEARIAELLAENEKLRALTRN